MTAGFDKTDPRDAPGFVDRRHEDPPKKKRKTAAEKRLEAGVVTVNLGPVAIDAPARADIVVAGASQTEELARAGTLAVAALAALRVVEVDTDERALWAGEKLHAVKARWKELEEKRTSVTKPMNEALRGVNEMFKGVQAPLAQAEAILKEKIGAYQARCRAQQAPALIAAAAGDIAALALTAPAPVLPGVSVREVWDFEINIADMVPRQFCSPDMAKIRVAITTNPVHGLVPQIPGVAVFKKNRVSST